MTRNLRIDWLYNPESRFHLASESIHETLWMMAFSLLWIGAELMRSARLHWIAGGLDAVSYRVHERRMRTREGDE